MRRTRAGQLTPEEKLIVYWESIRYIYELNRTSEIKAGLIMSFYGLVLGVTFEMAANMETNFRPSIFLIVVIIIYFFFVGRSIYFSFKCFLPHIETNFDKNMFFFHDVITQYGDIHSFTKKFHDLLGKEDELYSHLGQQIYVNSLIVSQKFVNVNKSVRNLAYSFIPMFVAVATIITTIFIL
ncbi:MAG: DUF5706 domain-containing protein [Eudoraea sp.]|nr:DUF5706 domain-containing protein [Eudoraea sp.]